MIRSPRTKGEPQCLTLAEAGRDVLAMTVLRARTDSTKSSRDVVNVASRASRAVVSRRKKVMSEASGIMT